MSARAPSNGSGDPEALNRRQRTPWLLVVLFVALVALFAAGLWGTLLRPAAYEVRGEIVARPAPGLLLVRHQAISGLGMQAMEMMAVHADPALLDAAAVVPGERVRLAVRGDATDVSLVWIRKD